MGASSDPTAMKPPNKAGRPTAEAVERRAEAKENANRCRTCRTQCRESVSPTPERVRKAEASRQTSAVGAACRKAARAVLCGGRPVMGVPTAIRLYGLPCSDDFAPGRGGLLQLLSMSLSPCCRFHPAEVNIRIGQSSAAHAAFALRLKARPSGILIFEATTRSPLLRPGDS